MTTGSRDNWTPLGAKAASLDYHLLMRTAASPSCPDWKDRGCWVGLWGKIAKGLFRDSYCSLARMEKNWGRIVLRQPWAEISCAQAFHSSALRVPFLCVPFSYYSTLHHWLLESTCTLSMPSIRAIECLIQAVPEITVAIPTLWWCLQELCTLHEINTVKKMKQPSNHNNCLTDK